MCNQKTPSVGTAALRDWIGPGDRQGASGLVPAARLVIAALLLRRRCRALRFMPEGYAALAQIIR